MTNFLKEVAAELVDRGILEPKTNQIADAMAARINRQGELYVRLFEGRWRGQVANGTREFCSEMAGSVYREIRK